MATGSPSSSLAPAAGAAIPTSSSSGTLSNAVTTTGLTDSRFRQCFNEMRESGEMCDVHIVVEDSSFEAHKLILAGCSPYFRGMFRQGNFDESKSNRILIDPKVCADVAFPYHRLSNGDIGICDDFANLNYDGTFAHLL